jgi:hypothetical protein
MDCERGTRTERYELRASDNELARWRAAASREGITLARLMRRALDGREAHLDLVSAAEKVLSASLGTDTAKIKAQVALADAVRRSRDGE